MRTLVFALLTAGAATQAAGCIISSGDDVVDDFALLTTNWNFRTIGGAVTNVCPPTYTETRVYAQPLDVNDNPIGQPEIALFDCANGTGTFGEPLDPADRGLIPGVYEVWYEITTSGGQVYAQSLSAIVDLSRQDQTFSSSILTDGGYFLFDWDLRDAGNNAPLSCADAGNPDSIEIIATLAGTTAAAADKFTCVNGIGLTAGLLEGQYQLSIAALNAQDESLGVPVDRTGIIQPPNRVTDLGTVQIPIGF